MEKRMERTDDPSEKDIVANSNKKRKVTLEKRTSKDNEIHRNNQRKKREWKEKEKRREKPVTRNEKQLAGRDYWENKFREMAQKGLREIPGVKEHIARIG